MKKTQIGVVGLEDTSDIYINNLQSFKAINILALASRGLEKAQTKQQNLALTLLSRSKEKYFGFCAGDLVHRDDHYL